MATKYRVIKNASKEERDMGYLWDLQRGDTIDGKIYWSPFIAYKTKQTAEDELKRLTK